MNYDDLDDDGKEKCYADNFPEHTKTSCDDNNRLYNRDARGHHCWRCNALEFDSLDTLRANLITAPDAVASEVIGHINTMYPDMWIGVPKSARVSIRNVIKRAVLAEMKRDLLPK